jgi:hypothetical protein
MLHDRVLVARDEIDQTNRQINPDDVDNHASSMEEQSVSGGMIQVRFLCRAFSPHGFSKITQAV